MTNDLTFILGGAASGKSRFAEALLEGTKANRIYIATAQAFDTEMADKIAAHQAQRGPGWTTVEAPLDLITPLADRAPTDTVLLDCATLWLTNILLADRDLTAEIDALITALAACSCPVIVVSNEVGQGIVPDNALSRRFRAAQGHLNQRLAAQAHRAALIVAGLPVVLKGDFSR